MFFVQNLVLKENMKLEVFKKSWGIVDKYTLIIISTKCYNTIYVLRSRGWR